MNQLAPSGRGPPSTLPPAGRRAFTRGDLFAAASLLTRASSLLSENDLFRLGIHRDLAEVLIGLESLPRADHLLVETIEAAAKRGERGLEYHSRIVRLMLQLLADPEGKADEAREELGRAIPILEEMGEERALAKAWRLKAVLHLMALRAGEMDAAAEEALEYARRSGDEPERHEILQSLALAIVLGATPVPMAIARAEKLLEQAKDDPGGKVFAIHALCLLNAMRGNFDEARRLVPWQEVSARTSVGAPCSRRGCRRWMGESSCSLVSRPLRSARCGRATSCSSRWAKRACFSTVAAMLAEALYRQGRRRGGRAPHRASEEAAASEDVISQAHVARNSGQAARRGGDSLPKPSRSPARQWHSCELRTHLARRRTR